MSAQHHNSSLYVARAPSYVSTTSQQRVVRSTCTKLRTAAQHHNSALYVAATSGQHQLRQHNITTARCTQHVHPARSARLIRSLTSDRKQCLLAVHLGVPWTNIWLSFIPLGMRETGDRTLQSYYSLLPLDLTFFILFYFTLSFSYSFFLFSIPSSISPPSSPR